MPKPLPPEAYFTFSPTSPEVGQNVTFDASNSSDPDGTIVNYFWSFGDGETENQTGGVTTVHSYTSEGSYNITLTVTDNDQLTNTTAKSITVSPPPKEAPEASFTYSPLNPEVNETITFNASGSSDPDGTIINYMWDFGDGTTGAGITATHSYTLNGNYTVALTVTDNDNLIATTTKTINNVIPEFPSWTPLLIMLVAVMVVSVIYKRKLQKQGRCQW
jgi:PKD repeat protein